MVRKNHEDNVVPPQQQYGGGGSVSSLVGAIDLIELNDDGTERSNSRNHHLKISPASAFKKASILKKYHGGDDGRGGELGGDGVLHAPPPLVLMGDDDDDINNDINNDDDNDSAAYAAQGGGEQQEDDDGEVVMALFKDPQETEQQQQKQHVETTTESVYVSHITLSDDKLPKLHAYLQESEWKGLFTTLQKMESLNDFNLNIFMNSINNEQETPLHTVCWKGPSQLALLMLETVNQQQRNLALLKKDISGNTPLHLACANLDYHVDFTIIKNLLLLCPVALDEINLYGDTPLHLLVTSPGFARSSSSVSTTTSTTSSTATTTIATTSSSSQHLYNFNIEAAAEEAITSLLQMVGHLATKQNYLGLTLLHCAIAHGAHERVLVKLLSMAPKAASIPDNRGMLPLHFVAAFGGKYNGTPWTFVSQLITAYEPGIITQSENGDTALHLLVSNAVKRTVSEGTFLNRNTTKLAELLVNTTTASNHHNNCNSSNYCLVSPLLIKNKVDLTPLHCCALFDTPAQLTQLIMECASNTPQSSIAEQASAITTKFGATPVHLACASSNPDGYVIGALATKLACCTRDDKDRTPLMVAVQNEKMPSQYIKQLITIYPHAVDQLPIRKGQYLPLHLAIKNNKNVKESVIRNLLKTNPKTIQAMTKSGNTALHLACQQIHPNVTIIKLLLERYRDASNICNKDGKLPIELVVKNRKSLLKKIPGLAGGGGEGVVSNKSTSASSSSSKKKSKKTNSSTSSSKEKKERDHHHHHLSTSSPSSSKKKAAAVVAVAASVVDKPSRHKHHNHHHHYPSIDRVSSNGTGKSSSSSTVHSTDDGGSEEEEGDEHEQDDDVDCCDDDNISNEVSCLTEPTCFSERD